VHKHISDAEIADIISKWLAQAPVRIERAKYVFTKCSVCIYLHIYLIPYVYFYVIIYFVLYFYRHLTKETRETGNENFEKKRKQQDF